MLHGSKSSPKARPLWDVLLLGLLCILVLHPRGMSQADSKTNNGNTLWKNSLLSSVIVSKEHGIIFSCSSAYPLFPSVRIRQFIPHLHFLESRANKQVQPSPCWTFLKARRFQREIWVCIQGSPIPCFKNKAKHHPIRALVISYRFRRIFLFCCSDGGIWGRGSLIVQGAQTLPLGTSCSPKCFAHSCSLPMTSMFVLRAQSTHTVWGMYLWIGGEPQDLWDGQKGKKRTPVKCYSYPVSIYLKISPGTDKSSQQQSSLYNIVCV